MRINTYSLFSVFFVAVFVAAASQAWAHQTKESEHHAQIRADLGEVEQLVSISANDLAHHFGRVGHHDDVSTQQLEELRGPFAEYIDDNTAIVADDELCVLDEAEFIHYPGGDGRVHYHQMWSCPENPEEMIISNRVMLDTHGGYRHTAQIQVGDNVHATVFDQNYPTFSVYPAAGDDDDVQQRVVDDAPSPDGDDQQPPTETSSEQEITKLASGVFGLLVMVVLVLSTLAVIRTGRSISRG